MVVGATGHQRLPTEVERHAQTSLRELGSQLGLVGVCSLAAGADQLFAEVVIESGGELWVVVPSEGYESSFAQQEDLERYRQLLDKAKTVEQLDFARPSEDAYFAAGRRVVDVCDKLVAIWDGGEARGLGGTGDVVAYARQQEKPVEVLWVEGAER